MHAGGAIGENTGTAHTAAPNPRECDTPVTSVSFPPSALEAAHPRADRAHGRRTEHRKAGRALERGRGGVGTSELHLDFGFCLVVCLVARESSSNGQWPGAKECSGFKRLLCL